jgi:exopolysaccharide biosynthesis predicted pyruvyltransferase EpsI
MMNRCEEGVEVDVCATVQMDELAKAISRLNSKKAVYIDRVTGKIIKLLFEHRAHNMLSMINFIYKIGKIPRKWIITRVIPLVKQGKDPLLPRSCRPISILLAMSKVWENT